jgi:HCOMODA/2-hydroxy-3-carboxy-muconic semialdehyde decarboxylase
VFRAVYSEFNARIQAEALKLGPVTYMTSGEAAASAASNASQIDRAWNVWKAQAGG